MNRKQILILVIAFAVSALIVWHDLPIEVPGVIVKMIMLFVKLSIVAALAIFAYIFAAGKKNSS
ncbi:MAG TPA: hypothetical protein VEM40_07200 [Nitrospirota bacterium]|nr:hypothetical protein [Nitrospirota bacterium]